jgi:hypothetical protein
MNNIYEVPKIEKPLYSTPDYDYVCIYAKHIDNAVKNRQFIHIRSKNTEGTFEPKWWRKTGQKIEKEYRIKGVPMVLYCNAVRINKPQTSEQEAEDFSRRCLI